MFCFRIPKEPLPERMVRRYSSVSVGETGETRSNSWVASMFGRRRSSSSSHKSIKIKTLSKQLSIEEAEINKERLAAVGDLMTAFYDDEDDVSSDQDDLIEELQDIGYLITPKNMVSEAKTDDHLNENLFKSKGLELRNEDLQCFR